MLQRCGSRAARARRQSAPLAFPLFWRRLPARRFNDAPPQPNRESAVPLRKQLKDETRAGRLNRGSAADSRKPAIRLDDWELTVGIEIHAQLNTTRKLFSVASTAPNDKPNSQVALFDLAVPGSLPRFQRATLLPAIRAAVALGCTIQPVSRFDRKHYFYHDQPAGYQITQYYEPFAKDGELTLGENDGVVSDHIKIGIKQIQMEQDTARTQEQDDDTNVVDYNRSGIPLIEIISLPHMHSPAHAAAYVRKVQALLLSVGAVATGMEMGGLRADVNVSVRRKNAGPGRFSYSGVQGLGQRTEIKNLSTLKGVEDAVKAERDRQIVVLEAGGVIEGETRGWSLAKPRETRRLRGKEGEIDYRYLPDADLAPIRVSRQVVEFVTNTLPILPDNLLAMLTDKKQYGLTLTDAKILLSIDSGERLEFFQEVVEQLKFLDAGKSREDGESMEDGESLNGRKSETSPPPWGRQAANWVLHELGSLLTTSEKTWSQSLVSTSTVAELIHHISLGTITMSTAKQILKMVFDGDKRRVEKIVKEENLQFQPLLDEDYARMTAEVIEANPDAVKDIREKGKTGKLMFLVGQVMRHNKDDGRIEAQRVEAALRKLTAS